MIRGLAHVCFHVHDLERSLRFYRDQLGLPVAFEFRNEQGHRYGVFLHCGGSGFLEFFQTDKRMDSGPPFDHVCLEVDDLEAVLERLTAAGLSPSPIRRGREGALNAWLRDPDGIRVELHQYPPDAMQAAYGKTGGEA